jgi:hypothetical protein
MAVPWAEMPGGPPRIPDSAIKMRELALRCRMADIDRSTPLDLEWANAPRRAGNGGRRI